MTLVLWAVAGILWATVGALAYVDWRQRRRNA